MITSCYLLEIGPNLSGFLVQLLIVFGSLAAAYRGQKFLQVANAKAIGAAMP